MTKLSIESTSVQNYLDFLQKVISRMASNSAGSKTWCVALVSAILVVFADKKMKELIWVAILPIILFMLLDAYYLALERGFRELYNSFVKKLHNDEANLDEIFVISPMEGNGKSIKSVFQAFGSFSIWPFYFFQIIILIVISFVFDF